MKLHIFFCFFSSNFDLLSGLANDTASDNFATINTTSPSNPSARPKDIFDPFESLGGGDGNNLLGGWSNFTAAAPPITNVTPQNNTPEQKSNDLFSDLGRGMCSIKQIRIIKYNFKSAILNHHCFFL